MRKNTTLGTFVLIVILLMMNSTAFAGPKIVLADLSWEEPQAINAILTQVLEERFDANVQTIRASQSAIFAGMAKGDGSVDVHPAVWETAQRGNIIKYVKKQGTVELNSDPYHAEDGWYIPTYTAKKYDIWSVSDLLSEDVAKHFDINYDGQGDYWPGAPGWGVTSIYQVKADSSDISKYYEPISASQAMFKAMFEDAYKNHKAMLFYWYAPTALPIEYNLTQLNEPEFTGYAMESKKGSQDYNPKGCYEFYPPQSGSNWRKRSEITCATPSQAVYIAYSSSLKERAPKVAEFLENVSFTLSQVNHMVYQLSAKNQSPKAMAQQWVKNHPDRIEQWFSAGSDLKNKK